VLHANVNTVHVDTDLGVAEVTPEAMKDFCKRHFPSKYDQFVEDMRDHPETLVMDLEQVLNALEKTPAYETLINVITKQTIETRDEIGDLSSFIVFQHFRSHAILRATIETLRLAGIERFEYFWLLKQAMSSPDLLFELILPLATSQWIIYKTQEHAFPLPDTPVLMDPGNVMIALSPRMLAEVDLGVHKPDGSWVIKTGIPKSKFTEYKRRAIANTYKEIVFHDPVKLEQWRRTPEFRGRVKLARSISYTDLVEQSLRRTIWTKSTFS